MAQNKKNKSGSSKIKKSPSIFMRRAFIQAKTAKCLATAFAIFAIITHLCSQEISVMYFNLCNYFVPGDNLTPIKPDFSKEAVLKIIKESNPDILITSEVGGEKSYADLSKNLNERGLDFKYRRIIEGFDTSRHLVLFSKFEPKEFFARTDQAYKIKRKNSDQHDEMRVLRGFIHAVFEFEQSYRLHIIGAHLKSKMFHQLYNQTDMRRYEARLLRYLVDEILEKEPSANILILGDMNDTFNSEPIRFIRADQKKPELRLYDMRPKDQWQITWTHWWNDFDAYGRIDYAFASYSLLPEIVQPKTRIVHIPELWMFASDHRPIFVTINTKEQSNFSEEIINTIYPKLSEQIDSDEESESDSANTGEE